MTGSTPGWGIMKVSTNQRSKKMAKKKHTYQFEVVLSVSDYGGDFESCKQDFDEVLEIAQEELSEAGVAEALNKMGGMEIKVDKFIEFDSGNPSHAGGYFLIEMSGSKEDVATVKKLHTKWMEGKKMKKQIKDLLIRLQDSDKPIEKCRLRKRLRALGHRGGSCGKIIKVKKSKPLSAKRKKEIQKHNREITQKIESREYKPFS